MMKQTSSTIARIAAQAAPFRWRLLLLFVLSFLSAPIALLKPYAIKLVIDCAFGNQPLPSFITFFFPKNQLFPFSTIIFLAAALVIVLALIENAVMLVTWVMSTAIGEKMVLYFRARIFNHVQRLSLTYHDTTGTADTIYRLQWGAVGIRTLLLGNIAPLLTSVLTLLAMVAVIFYINVLLAVVALSVLLPLYFLVKSAPTRLQKRWEGLKEKESRALSVVQEVLTSLRVVKAFGQEAGEEERFVQESGKAVSEQVKVAWMAALFYLGLGMVFAIATASFIYLGASFVKAGTMTLGDLTLMLAYLTQFFAPLQNISKIITDIQSSLASVNRVFRLLDTAPEVQEQEQALSLGKATGQFTFDAVSFAYNEKSPTLHDLSLRIQPGDRVGIMGSTGSGKSTLTNLLLRFYDPAEGAIELDGTDVRHYNLSDYRKQFSIVLQEPVLFSTSIYENIRYGKPDATEKEIIAAAKAANAHEFILRCKDGYHAPVGERGMQLSGGERQRISIARAFLKNAPVLILDEPTSSLDVRTEAQIMEAVERLMLGRTTFMITHRLDTLRSCNVILHLEKGRLVEIVRDGGVDFVEKKKKSFFVAQE